MLRTLPVGLSCANAGGIGDPRRSMGLRPSSPLNAVRASFAVRLNGLCWKGLQTNLREQGRAGLTAGAVELRRRAEQRSGVCASVNEHVVRIGNGITDVGDAPAAFPSLHAHVYVNPFSGSDGTHIGISVPVQHAFARLFPPGFFQRSPLLPTR